MLDPEKPKPRLDCWLAIGTLAPGPTPYPRAAAATRIEGYAIQSHDGSLSAPLFGWKIAATSLAGQRHINVDGPAGRLLAERLGGAVSPRRARCAWPRSNSPSVSLPVTAFVRHPMKSLMDAVASLHPAIEIPDSRYDDFCAVSARNSSPTTPAPICLSSAGGRRDGATWTLRKHPVVAVSGKSQHNGTGAAVLGTRVLRLPGSSMNCRGWA